jgi:hypothetical protein
MVDRVVAVELELADDGARHTVIVRPLGFRDL